MERSQTKLLTILVSILALAGVIWAFGTLPSPENEGWDPNATVSVWDLEKSAIVGIETESNGLNVKMEKVNDVWWIVEPERHLASPATVDVLVGGLVDIKLGIGLPKPNLVDFGLDEEHRKSVQVVLASGDRETLWVGDPAPIGWRTYVQRPDGQASVVVGRLGQTVFLSVNDLRDRAFLRFDVANSASAKISSAAGTLEVFSEHGRWWVRGFGRASMRKVEELFVGLANLRVEGWLDGVAEDGIGDPVFDVEVRLKDGEQHGFKIGGSMPMGRLVQTDSGLSAYAREESLAMLNQGPNYVADPKALPISMSETKHISGTVNGATFKLTDEGGIWKMENGANGEGLLDLLFAAPAVYVPDVPEEPEGPFSTILIEDQDGSQRTVQIGQEFFNGKGFVATEGPFNYRYYIAAEAWHSIERHLSDVAAGQAGKR